MDYYRVLEVERDASPDIIRAAYRRLVMIWHPDKNKDMPVDQVESRFKQISTAYLVLSDPEKKKTYDQSFEKIDQIFGDTEVPAVIVPVECTMVEAYNGTEKTVSFKRYSQCSDCEGTGSRTKIYNACKKCNGGGSTIETAPGGENGFVLNEEQCNECKGKGIDPDDEMCDECQGNRFIVEEAEYNLHINPGAHNRQIIKLPGEGNQIPPEEKSENNRSDVWFVIQTPDRETINNIEYRREIIFPEAKSINHSDLMIDLEITLAESLCGFYKEFKHIDGTIKKIKKENITINNCVVVLSNCGMPGGDLIIRLKIKDCIVNKKQQRRLWQILAGTAYNHDMKKHGEELINFDQWIGRNN